MCMFRQNSDFLTHPNLQPGRIQSFLIAPTECKAHSAQAYSMCPQYSSMLPVPSLKFPSQITIPTNSPPAVLQKSTLCAAGGPNTARGC